MQNNNLYQSLSALTRKSLGIISNTIDKNLAITTETTWVKHDDETYVRKDIKRPLWSIVLYKAEEEIAKTEEFVVFSEITKSDQIISSQINTLVGTCMSQSRFELPNLIFTLLSPFLTDTEIIGFDESIFKTEYLKVENSLYSNEIELERLTPLCGFFTDIPNLALDNNLSIVKMSEHEITDLLRLGMKIGDSFRPDNFIHQPHEFAIKSTFSLPKVIGEKNIQGSFEALNPYIKGELEQTVISALRLFKDGKVYSLGTVTKSKSVFSSSISYNHGTPSRPFMKNQFQLIEDEKDKFLGFWRIYRGTNIPEKHFLSVAIRRFSQANERENIEDKVIDFLISAEALFLSSGGSFQGELKYRLSHRAAMFIEGKTEKQRKVFKFMQNAYDARSAIVHGTAPKLPAKEDGTFYSLDEFCKEVEAYLRFSLNKAITLASTAESPSKILEWDSIIFPPDN